MFAAQFEFMILKRAVLILTSVLLLVAQMNLEIAGLGRCCGSEKTRRGEEKRSNLEQSDKHHRLLSRPLPVEVDFAWIELGI